MKYVVSRYKIDNDNEIYFSCHGFESVKGNMAHKIMFKILKEYSKSNKQVSQGYYTCIVLEKLASNHGWKLKKNCYSYDV